MKIGDLVRWTMFGDLGVIVSVMKGYWKPYYRVYLFNDREVCCIRLEELEVIGGL